MSEGVFQPFGWVQVPDLPGEPLAASHMTLHCALNQIPAAQATVSRAPASSAGFEILSTAEAVTHHIQDASALQTLMYASSQSRATAVMGLVGHGRMSLNGFLQVPSVSVGMSDTNIQLSVAHMSMLLNRFDGSIYKPAATWRQHPGDTEGLNTLPSLFKYALTKLYEALPSAGEMIQLTNLQEAEIARIHTANATGYAWVSRLLDASDTSSLDDVILSAVDKDWVVTYAMASLRSRGSMLFRSLLSLAEAFGLVYVPSWTDIGKLVPKRDLIAGDAVDLVIDPTQIVPRLGGFGGFPITRVLTTGAPTKRHRDGEAGGPEERMRNILAYWPLSIEDDLAGGVMEIPPPPWLKEINLNENDYMRRSNTGSDAAAGSVDAFLAERQRVAEASIGQQSAQMLLLTRWCRNHYAWSVLGSSSMTLPSMPLNMDLVPGQRVRLVSSDGAEPIATGVTRDVTHNVRVSGQSGTSETSLSLSHVELAGFELANK
jgi:hypothetical protein